MSNSVKQTLIISGIISVMVLGTLFVGIRIIRRESRSMVNEAVEKAKRSAALRAKANDFARGVKEKLDKTDVDERASAAAKDLINNHRGVEETAAVVEALAKHVKEQEAERSATRPATMP